MNFFSETIRLCGRNGGFQIHDPQIDGGFAQFLERITPDVIEADRSGYRAIGCFGELDICARVPNIPLVQNRIHRMRQRLIDAAAGHYIAAEKQTQRHGLK